VRLPERLQRLLGRLRGEVSAEAGDDFAPVVAAVGALGEEVRGLSDAALRERAVVLGERVRRGEPAEAVLVPWFALVREASERALGMRPFDVQLLGAAALHAGRIVEMETGEGKTLAAVFPASLEALTGRGVHVLTANDYLARRDVSWMGPVYRQLGLRVAAIGQGSARDERRSAYGADVTYLSANEAGFDFLRDRLARREDDIVQRPYEFGLVDEADSILIDEARVPLVIAGATGVPGGSAVRLASLIEPLREGHHFQRDPDGRNARLTDAGIVELEERLGVGSLYDAENIPLLAAANVALHARVLLRRDVDYVVKDGAIHLVDEFKGRIADRRRWPDGIHTALEAKEGLSLTREGRVLGSITLQSFVALYPKLSGMTGTAATQAQEFRTIFGLTVVVVPPNRPRIRSDLPDAVYARRADKERAAVEEIRRLHASLRPVLVGTASVAESDRLASLVRGAGVECRVLNARNDDEEAAVIAEAGDAGAVTISTNMAGRGVDIRLGGAREERADAVRALGGLFVLGTNRHESRRIDDQLRGRAGRQGDPGASRFYVSLEDDLFTMHGAAGWLPPHVREWAGEGPVDDPAAGKAIAHAQRILEGQNLEIRRTLLRYDRLLEEQRKILAFRREEAPPPTNLLEMAAPDRWVALRDAFGEELVNRVERDLTVGWIDRLWSDHLENVAELREGMPLRTLGAQDPLYEYHRALVALFDDLLRELDARVVETFETAEITSRGVDLGREGLESPSSTWTYLVNDQPFGSTMERIAKNVVRAAKGLLRGW
jgi:preprotein translocase subunit SecA